MYAVEFNTHIENGTIQIPKRYKNLQEVDAKITIMIDDIESINNTLKSETMALSNSSANTIDEWKDEKEDEVWI